MKKLAATINIHVRFLLAILLLCSMHVFSSCENNGENEEREVLLWLDRMPVLVSSVFDMVDTDPPRYKSLDEWQEAGRKLENIEDRLIKIFEKNSDSYRLEVTYALMFFGTNKSISTLINVYNDRNMHNRARGIAAITLGKMKAHEACGPLSKTLLTTYNRTLSTNTIIGLGELGDPNGVPAVKEYAMRYSDYHSGRKMIVNEALEKMGSKKLFPLPDEIPQPIVDESSKTCTLSGYESFDEWRRAHQESLCYEELLLDLYKKDPSYASDIVWELQSYATDKSIPILFDILNDIRAKHSARIFAASILVKLNVHAPSQPICKIVLSTSNHELAMELIFYLGELGDPDSISVIEKYAGTYNDLPSPDKKIINETLAKLERLKQ